MSDPLRIAVIDSGVHPEHPHIDAARLLPGLAVATDGAVTLGAEASLDRLGHGTAVIAAIQDQAADALCMPIRVFHDGLRTSARALIGAIAQAVAAQADIINLSLGTLNPAHHGPFEDAARAASEAGALIISARDMDGVPCLPGCLPDVLGVSLDWDCPRAEVRFAAAENEGPFLFASGHPRPIPGVAQQRNLHGISFAVANMTGIVARLAAGRGRGQAITKAEILSTIQKQPIAPTA